LFNYLIATNAFGNQNLSKSQQQKFWSNNNWQLFVVCIKSRGSTHHFFDQMSE